jgi:hypothetical protein
MVMKMKSTAGRAPSAALARAMLKKRAKKQALQSGAQAVESAFRKAGGFGKSVVSIHVVPKGGIEKSPAYKKLLSRCASQGLLDKNGKPPPPEQRSGAPLKGGFPLSKYPPNVIVDCQRCAWLPDEFAQVMKNTGPGGVYFGWMDPSGKFMYHRSGYPQAIEESLGRKLTVMDGLNGLTVAIKKFISPKADKTFLQECLSPQERKFVAKPEEFHFGVVSGKRANIESGQIDIMIVETHFKLVGITPTWYVDAESFEDYKKMGLKCKVGGKLCPARNMILNDAKARGKVAVEISDDIGKWIYYNVGKQNYSGQTDFKKANNDLLGAPKHVVSPLAAAQFILAKMRSDPDKPRLGGVFPTSNPALALGTSEFGKHHFILGDFFVAELSPCRFDENLTLKEDYDYTCQHLKTHGSVLRCHRLFLQVKHSTNAGGAVAARDARGEKERKNIALLMEKWPGVFRANTRRKTGDAGVSEVTMNWNRYGKGDSDESFAGKSANLKVRKTMLKKPQTGYSANAKISYTKQTSKVKYLNARCSRCHKKTVDEVLGMKYKDGNGTERSYALADLKYDIQGGRLTVTK